MRSSICVLVLTVVIGFLLASLPIWPWMGEVWADPSMETLRDYEALGKSWQSIQGGLVLTPLIVSYLNATRQIQAAQLVSTKFYNFLFCILHPFILVFLSKALAQRLQNFLIYLWDLP